MIPPEYQALLDKFPDILKVNFKEEHTKNGVVHRINIKKNSKPVKAKLRQLLPGSQKAIKAKEAFDELIKLGVVEKVNPAKSNNWLSPIHWVLKPDGTLRTVGDYRGLNDATELDSYPLPQVRDYAHTMAGSVMFSKVDLKKAFHQILIDKHDRHFTCVTTPWGLYNFRRLSMGMANSAKSFQRLIESVVSDMKDEGVFCYFDDLLIHSKSKEEHLNTLEKLFKRLSDSGLSLAMDKCVFGVDSIDYLGYNISQQGMAPIEKKVEALQKFPSPTKQKELLAFLGARNYYRASLPHLDKSESVNPDVKESRSPAEVLDPLYKMATCKLRKVKGEFERIWNTNKILSEAYQDSKNLLKKAVRLNYPVPSAPIALSTDASQKHLCASLEQFVNGKWAPMAFWSKSLKPEQQRYSTYRTELLAIKLALRNFIDEINGRELIIFSISSS